MRVSRLFYTVLAITLMSIAMVVSAQTIVDNRHNLSISGPGPIKSSTESEICIFCHTPHNARRDIPYLWNREDSTVNYSTYDSSTMHATVDQPTGASKMCLSCHDGTIALGKLVTRTEEIPFEDGVTVMPDGPSKLGSDISDDHPVSFLYDSGLAAANGELVDPSSLPEAIRLDKNGMLQCTACHDPHDNTFGNFLVIDNVSSTLCIACHDRTDWSSSSHATSVATWNGTAPDPWPRSDYTHVNENACENCHQQHAAGGHERLLNYAIEESNCFSCHNSNVAAKDIETQTTKFYGHGVHLYLGVHDAAEDFTSTVQSHVECVDCHNPHRSNDSTTTATATAPDIPTSMLGVSGINAVGNPLEESVYVYEICFKCHADNNVATSAAITRQVPQLNTRLEFDTANPSYHPVEAAGRNPDMPSLIWSDYDEFSIIYCSDCHSSDDGPATGGVEAAGPHGSVYEYILEENYTTADNTVEDSFVYALCYKCHDRVSIRANESFPEHYYHIVDKNAPCSACHDPHGSQVNTHLINFDTSIVTPNSKGVLRFVDSGSQEGNCSLTCHGIDHDNKIYPKPPP